MIGAPVNAENLGLPADVWMLISQRLKPADFNHFIRAVKLLNRAGTRPHILEGIGNELYARLCAMDLSLPAKLGADFLAEYKAAFKKIVQMQTDEIFFLAEKHPAIVNLILAQPAPPNLTPLQRLEHTNKLIDAINIAIILPLIQPNHTTLYLDRVGITRLPLRLTQDPNHKTYFDQLEEIHCDDNDIRVLVIKNLPRLERLYCNRNLLSHLMLNSLPELHDLQCADNEIKGVFDLRSFPHMDFLRITDNYITHLRIEGLMELHVLLCDNNQLEELFVESDDIATIRCRNNKLKTIRVKNLVQLNIPLDNNYHVEDDLIDIRNNPLESIPQNLIDEFGQEWADQMLGEQPEITDDEEPAASSDDDQPEDEQLDSSEELDLEKLHAPEPSLLMSNNMPNTQKSENNDSEEELEEKRPKRKLSS